jgi:hypothetical protein
MTFPLKQKEKEEILIATLTEVRGEENSDCSPWGNPDCSPERGQLLR